MTIAAINQKASVNRTAMDTIKETSQSPMNVDAKKNQLSKIREDVQSVKPQEEKKGGWIDSMA